MKLTDVKGIGDKASSKLIEEGIDSVEKLAIQRPDYIKLILGVNLKKAKEIINDAKSKVLDKVIALQTIKEIEEYRKQVIQYIPTGCKSLDKLLGGGIPTTSSTCLIGEYASGKTQMCMQLGVNILSKLNRGVAWIETESGAFIPDRVNEIAKTRGLNIKADEFLAISSRYISSPHSLFLAYERIERVMKEGKDIGLIVVDSFSKPFRSYYIGREMLPDRSSETSRHLGYLDYLASKYNLAVVLTIQVMDIPDAKLQLRSLVKVGQRKYPVGGNVLLHGGTYLIGLRKVSLDTWEATIFDSPNIPMSTVKFKIAKKGIIDA